MKSILAHHGGSRKYLSILRHLKKNIPSLQIEILHNKAYDIFYVQKPQIIFFPVNEYTQEIHTLFSEKHQLVKIILYIDVEIQQTDLKEYLFTMCSGFIIDQNKSDQKADKGVYIKDSYDSDIFKPIDIKNKNTKVAVALSNDLSKNDKYLKEILYPKEKELQIVLFNNPEYKHIQNIGIFNEADLNHILNTFGYFMDLDDEFTTEAHVVGCKVLDKNKSIKEAIKNKDFLQLSTKAEPISNLVINTIIPYMETR
jgi:hypothetical protein